LFGEVTLIFILSPPQLFGEDLKTADGDGQLSFEEYLQAVRVRIIPEPQVSNPMPTKGGKSRSKKR